jgi:tetratricopeptide (TPR) repeat protein
VVGTDLSGNQHLAELMDMYHTHEATERHDMVFALLGMSSDDLTGAGLSPDYDVPWAKVFMNFLLFVFGKTLPIETLGNGDLAVVKAKGHVIGEVSSVERNISWSDRQEVDATFWNEATKSRDRVLLTFLVSAKSILERDLICLFEHTPELMIVRACKDYFRIIKIAAVPHEADLPLEADLPHEADLLHETDLPHEADLASDRDYSTDSSHRMNEYVNWAESVDLIKTPPREFLLVWDWEMSEGAFQHQEYRDLESKWCEIQTGSTMKAERLSNAALILAEHEDFAQAKERIQEAIDFCEDAVGKDHPSTLRCMDALGLMYKSNEQWEEAEAALIQVIQARIRVQGASHSNTLSSMNSFKDLASAYERASKKKEAQRTEAILEVLKGKQGDKLTEKDVIYFAGSLDAKAMLFLLETRGHEFKITEDVLKAAVGNGGEEAKNVTNLLLDRRKEEIKITEQVLKAAAGNIYGEGIIHRFLEERGGEFKITEGVVTAAAENLNGSVMELLLRHRGDEFKVTETVVKAAAGNSMGDVLCTLLRERGDEVKITEAVMKAAAENELGYWTMRQLLESRGNEITITEEVLIAAAENRYGDEMVRLLVDRRGGELRITPQVLNAAARSLSGDKTIRYLLEIRGDEVKITEEIVKAAVGNWKCGNEIIELLLDQRRDEVEVTEEVLRAASAVELSRRGARLMSLLLDRLEDAATIPHEILRAIPKYWDSQEKISKYIQNEWESWAWEVKLKQRKSTGKK